MEYLKWVEQSVFSVWIRESSWAFFAILTVHTISMGFVLGTGVAISLRVLGFAPRIQLPQLPTLLPVIYTALVFVITSGVLLLIAYPAKALTIPLFYIKMSALVAALLLTRRLCQLPTGTMIFPFGSKLAALLCILFWATVLMAGKYLEYAFDVVMLS